MQYHRFALAFPACRHILLPVNQNSSVHEVSELSARSRMPRRPAETLSKDVARELPQVFFRLLMSHRAWIKSGAMSLGLSAFQAMTMLFMDPGRPQQMSEVAATIGCGPSNLTGIVDKLEARGFVKRRPGSGDRRVKEVSLTRAG